jgi:peptidoglycan/xylan/chitin deacetylase (PgdA/CDA1 family)
MIRAAIFLLVISLTQASLLLAYPLTPRSFLLAGSLYTAGSLVSLYLVFHPRNQWLVDNRSRVVCNGRPCVALTFDDGPDPATTPRVLDMLREKQVRATFFVVGKRAERHPELVRRALAEGHLVENHTWSHPSLFCFLTPGRLRAEIEQCAETVARIGGRRPRYFRSPVGLRHALLRPYLRRAGLEYISWQTRGYDTLNVKSGTLAGRILNRVMPGDIVLLHDYRAGGVDVLLGVLPRIIDELRTRGFDFVRVDSECRATEEVRGGLGWKPDARDHRA